MSDPTMKYTLVRGADNKLYAVTEQGEITKPLDSWAPSQVQQIENALTAVQGTVATALAVPLGSGVRVKVPQIFD